MLGGRRSECHNPGMDILVVDDNSDIRRIMLHRLGSLYFHGTFGEFSVREAANGREAVHLVASSRPDVIFMDVKMPVLEGIEATALVRQMPGGSDIHVVCTTPDPRAFDMWRAWGFDSLLMHPIVDPHLITKALAAALALNGKHGADQGRAHG